MSGNITEINKDTFWMLITEAKARCGQDMDASAKWVEEQLLQMGPEQAQNFASINNTLPPSDAPAYFYYNGNLYSFSGKMVYSLPEDFKFVSEVNNIGDSYTSVDFDGNVDGYIFMSESDESIAYFQWKEWDESTDGKEPYLVLILEE